MIASKPQASKPRAFCPRVSRDVPQQRSPTLRAPVLAHAAYPFADDAGFAVPSEAWAEQQTEQRSKVSAEIKVHAPADVLWSVLTDFSSHAYLMPNVEQCERLPSRNPDTVLLFQKVFSQAPFWRLEASAMLEYRQKRAGSWKKMNFRMVSGDFAELSGHWVVAEDPNTPSHSVLRYEIVFLPAYNAAIPCAMKQFLAKQVLPCNIMALVSHAEQLSQTYASQDKADMAPGWIPDRRPMYLGVSSVPLPGQRSRSSRRKSQKRAKISSSFELGPSTSVSWSQSEDENRKQVDSAVRSVPIVSKFTDMELHIRKLDTKQKLHWRLLTSVPVNASAEAIWEVLTNYEQLEEVVPLLLVSEEKKTRSGKRKDKIPKNLKRVRQVAAKQLPYVQLHTEVVLDVLEKPGTDTWELQFRHHKSSFDILQGKWVIERLPSTAGSPQQASHVLKYAVELALHAKPSRFIDLMEPLIQRSIAEDLPVCLDAIRKAAESLNSQGHVEQKRSGKEVLKRAEKSYAMFEELRAELTALYGSRMQLPNRKELLSGGRVDLINAIKAHGGYTQVAEQLQWSVARISRRPRGYWSSMANLQHELDLFNDEFDQPMDTIPRKSLMQKVGRYDLVKGLERNGGAHGVAEILGYTIASGRSAVSEPKVAGLGDTQDDVEETAAREVLEEVHTTGHSDSSLLPSIDELLMDTDTFDESTYLSSRGADRRGSDAQRLWSGLEHTASWASDAHCGDAPDWEPRYKAQGVNDETLTTGGNASVLGKLSTSRVEQSGNNARKLNLNIRDVDERPYIPQSGAWAPVSQPKGRRVLSKADLAALLSERPESRDSI